MFSILLAASLVSYLIVTAIHYGLISVHKSNVLRNKTSSDRGNAGNTFSGC